MPFVLLLDTGKAGDKRSHYPPGVPSSHWWRRHPERAAVLLAWDHVMRANNQARALARVPAAASVLHWAKRVSGIRTVAGDAQVGADGVQARAAVLLVGDHILLASHPRRAGALAAAGGGRPGRDERALRGHGALAAGVAARAGVGRRLVRRRALAREGGCGERSRQLGGPLSCSCWTLLLQSGKEDMLTHLHETRTRSG